MNHRHVNSDETWAIIEPLLPSTQGRGGGWYHDVVAYRDRNVVERGINRFKHWRELATRYDKIARNYLGGLHLASILLWANDLAESGDRA